MSFLGILKLKTISEFHVVLLLIIVIIKLNLGVVQSARCPGICTNNATRCKNDGGKIVGYCTNSKACCDLTANISGSCGQSFGTESDIIHFKSPMYPNFLANNLLCEFSFKLQEETVGVLLEFIAFETDGVRFGPAAFDCDVDYFFITGFTGWTPPPLCGFLQSYKMLIDKGKMDGTNYIKFVAVMSSSRYRWHIKIHQIHKSDCKGKDFVKLKTGNSESNLETLNNTAPSTSSSLLDDNATKTPSIVFSEDAYGHVKNPNKHRDQYERIPQINGKRKRRGVEKNGETAEDLNLNLDGFFRDEGGLRLQPLVVNGDDSTNGKVPWQASLRYDFIKLKKLYKKKVFSQFEEAVDDCDKDEGIHFCGGTIISDREILTAAHCFASHTTKNLDIFPLYSIKVVLGDINNCQDSESQPHEKHVKNSTSTSDKTSKTKYRNPNVQEFGVESVTLHYAYDRIVVMNDVAIIRLNGTIKFNKNVHAIDMAETDEDFSNESAFVSGWGQVNLTNPNIHDVMPHVLQYSDNLQIKPNSYCKAQTLRYLQSSEQVVTLHKKYHDIFKTVLCSGSSNKTRDVLVGPGDSGGPLVVINPDNRDSTDPVLVGIVSYGSPTKRKTKHAAGDFVDYYQNVGYYRKWIDIAICALRNSRNFL